MVPKHAHLLTSDFTQWVQKGFLINSDETEDVSTGLKIAKSF